jgi:hypothetical protein
MWTNAFGGAGIENTNVSLLSSHLITNTLHFRVRTLIVFVAEERLDKHTQPATDTYSGIQNLQDRSGRLARTTGRYRLHNLLTHLHTFPLLRRFITYTQSSPDLTVLTVAHCSRSLRTLRTLSHYATLPLLLTLPRIINNVNDHTAHYHGLLTTTGS